MAQDAGHSGLPPPDSRHVWDEKQLEKPVSTPDQLDVPQGVPNSGARSPGPGRNHTPEPSGNVSRSPDPSVFDEDGDYRYQKPRIRTLPGILDSYDGIFSQG